MRKRALLIGINDYRDPRAKLRGCVNDVTHVERLLRELYGFQAADISVLLDAQATKKNIESRFTSLLRHVSEGDRAFFFYAGHGTRVHSYDPNEQDQLDECIMPWETTYDSLIKDDWFGERLKRLAAAGHAANITLVFDCCHSGTITREFLMPWDEPSVQPGSYDEVVRNRWFPSSLLAPTVTLPDEQMAVRARSVRARSIETGPWDVLSACQDEETAADTYLEGEFRGAFSYSLISTLRENPLTPFNTLEYQVVRRLRRNVPRHPQEPHFMVRDADNSFLQTSPDQSGVRSVDIALPIGMTRPRGYVQTYSVYAAPMTWGPWGVVGSHGGPVPFSISAKPVGGTVIVGEVRYYDASGNQKTEGFHKKTTVRTGNSWANVEVRFKGVPMGSAVTVTVK